MQPANNSPLDPIAAGFAGAAAQVALPKIRQVFDSNRMLITCNFDAFLQAVTDQLCPERRGHERQEPPPADSPPPAKARKTSHAASPHNTASYKGSGSASPAPSGEYKRKKPTAPLQEGSGLAKSSQQTKTVVHNTPIGCSICNRWDFATPERLLSHNEIWHKQSNARFECVMCTAAYFPTENDLREHLETRHTPSEVDESDNFPSIQPPKVQKATGIPSLAGDRTCTVCHQEFRSPAGVGTHIRRMHPTEYRNRRYMRESTAPSKRLISEESHLTAETIRQDHTHYGNGAHRSVPPPPIEQSNLQAHPALFPTWDVATFLANWAQYEEQWLSQSSIPQPANIGSQTHDTGATASVSSPSTMTSQEVPTSSPSGSNAPQAVPTSSPSGSNAPQAVPTSSPSRSLNMQAALQPAALPPLSLSGGMPQ